MLYLRIARRFVNLLPTPTDDQPDPDPLAPPLDSTGILNVIVTPLSDLHPFSGDTVDWLIRVARLIFEPLGTSSLYTFTTGSVQTWLDKEIIEGEWRRVQFGEELMPTIYEFRPNNHALITPTRISGRQSKSVTTSNSYNQSTAFRLAVLERHSDQCIISTQNQQVNLIASHLIPKRLGDFGVRSVIHRFTNLQPTTMHRFSPIIGIPLFKTLDTFADTYDLGFWNCGPDRYVIHNFSGYPLNHLGAGPMNPQDPLVHGHQIILTSSNLTTLPLPPTGIFNWHYIQCILKHFSTPEYKSTQNICYFCLPFRTREDIEDDESDRDFDDERNIANPPYPSYMIDLSQYRALQRLEEEERNRTILTWSSRVFTS